MSYFRATKTKCGFDFRSLSLPGRLQTDYHKSSCLLPSGFSQNPVGAALRTFMKITQLGVLLTASQVMWGCRPQQLFFRKNSDGNVSYMIAFL